VSDFGNREWLAADFEADVADGLLVGDWVWLAADFEGSPPAPLKKGGARGIIFSLCSGWFVGGRREMFKMNLPVEQTSCLFGV